MSDTKNLDSTGLCRGLDYTRGRPTRCMSVSFNKHLSPRGDTFFLCERHEDMVMEALDAGGRAVNGLVFGGSNITGVKG